MSEEGREGIGELDGQPDGLVDMAFAVIIRWYKVNIQVARRKKKNIQ